MVAGQLALLHTLIGRWMLKVAQVVAPIIADHCMLLWRIVVCWPRYCRTRAGREAGTAPRTGCAFDGEAAHGCAPLLAGRCALICATRNLLAAAAVRRRSPADGCDD
ncbi:hypothetical protein F511_15695 [Dorcoceras hygrometricum]|uniref:Uncharacterized protein n=1 Tax=Dorcoceras hygrometricum TaxID=472368 RepID=A0A2Z7BEU4_9LAMI|nr:hypothetical protein F511_15695 [Dorcoceras hygrometricum]